MTLTLPPPDFKALRPRGAAAAALRRPSKSSAAAAAAAAAGATAGPQWFDMPATKMTPELEADLAVLRARSVLDPTRHYSTGAAAAAPPPRFSQLGTVIAPPHEYYSARLTRRQRRATLAEQVLADGERVAYVRRRAAAHVSREARIAAPATKRRFGAGNARPKAAAAAATAARGGAHKRKK